MKIAVIGGGASGLVAARQLSLKHDVDLYEAERALGGHAYSAPILNNSRPHYFDLGFELFSERQAPNLCCLLKELGIKTFVCPLSFAAIFGSDGDMWDNLGSPTKLWTELVDEFEKFHFLMSELYSQGIESIAELSINDFLIANNFSNTFITKALLPIFTTFVGSRASLLDYSLSYCAASFANNYLSFFQPTYWRKIQGGVSNYISRLASKLNNVKINTRATKVEKVEEGIYVHCDTAKAKHYDKVVLAVHADIALNLLVNPSQEAKRILGHFKYTGVESILHTDDGVMPASLDSHIYCFYNQSGRKISGHLEGSMTRHFNKLYPYNNLEQDVYVTIDPKSQVNPEKIIASKHWKLPMMRPQDMQMKREIKNIQGKDNIWYCGLDTTITGHEGSILSGFVIAEALGTQYPYAHNQYAKAMYDMVKNIMEV